MKMLRRLFRKIPEGFVKELLRRSVHNVLFILPVGWYEFACDQDITLKMNKYFLIDEYTDHTEIEGYTRKYELQKGDIVVDAGAYDGLFAMYAAKKIGNEGKVICFEPEELNVTALKRNFRLNQITNCIIVKKGLWNTNQELTFSVRGDSSRISRSSRKWFLKKIEAVRLDDELQKLGIQHVDFIKMDIEGAEIEAVQGCSETIKRCGTKLAIASYHKVNGKKTYIELHPILEKMNLQPVTEYPAHLTTYA